MQVYSGHYQNDLFPDGTVGDQGGKFIVGYPSLPGYAGEEANKTKHMKD